MSNRVLVVSWDGATFDILDPMISHGYMPNLAALIESGSKGRLYSCIPPVTAAAWASFQTGKNPGKHGVFDFLSYVPGRYQPELVNSASIRTETLQELLGRSDKKCIVLNVPVTYPPRAINGLLVSGLLTPALENTWTFPEELETEILQYTDYEILVYPRSFWQKGAIQFVKDLIRAEQKRLNLTRYLAREHDWDFLMVHIQSTDTLQHMLWDQLYRLANAGEPESELDQLILEFFAMIDSGIQQLGQMLDNSDRLILLSDHGFGSVTNTFHINDWLIKEGFLSVKGQRAGFDKLRRLRTLLKRVDVFDLRLRAGFLHRNSPLQRLKRLGLSSISDWSHTKAFALMGSACAGVYVNLRGRELHGIVEGDEYEQIRQELIERVEGISEIDGVRAYRREDLYSGPYLDLMPDVVVIPGESCHIATGLSDTGHFLSPCTNQTGDHRMDGILVMHGDGIAHAMLANVNIFDLAPTILHFFDLPIPSDMDGRIIGKEMARQSHSRGAIQEMTLNANAEETYSSQEEEEVRRRLADLGYLD